MENSKGGCGADIAEGSRAKPFDIDLNETPVCSPRELVFVAADRTTVGCVGLLDINAMPPTEEETTQFETSRLVSNYHSLEPQSRSDGFAWMQKGLDLNQLREDSLIFSQVKNCKECPESFGFEESQAYKLKSSLRVTPASSEANGSCDPLQVGLPVQFEDFCILAVGDVDPRPSYHSTSQIWPVGYRCSWHDKITGSLFACEVTDGGDHGPLFKIKRYPCSAQPIPVGSTVLLRPSFSLHDKCEVDTDNTICLDDDECTNIHMLFSDDSPPHLECNVLSEFRNDFDEAHTSESKKSLPTKSNCPSHHGRPTTTYKELEDDIGEFLVEARSSSSVWGMVSQTLVHACRKAYERTGVCKFRCKHDHLRRWSSCFVSVDEEATEDLDSLEKFCCVSGPINIPHLIRNNDELNTSCKVLVKWLEQDRFGLDVEFVQEIIEQHPRVYLCAEYIFLNKRSHKSISQTVGSGFLRVARKGHLHEKDADISTLRGCKRPKEHVIENPVMKSCFFPGKPLSSKIPAELIGDVLQSWELLWRFSEVLGLEQPLSFKELEEELIYGHSSTLRSSSSSAVSQENEHSCVDMENDSLREAAHGKQTSNSNSRCSGVALVTVLCSLLKILLGELQSKVAAFVDSNFDGGETKSRRRRKKDADNSFSAKKVMLDLLPINGLTWPELARRYVLTVSSMQGNLEFGDFVNHENGKALHCLQGDGGTIRGSLPGVAGMEADALLLAEATKQIFGALKSKNDIASVDYYESDATVGRKTVKVNDNGIPEWAQVLEPVRKLPTNVGARIRKCVYEALDKHPPEWAKKRLEHSISKEVYKGNASGPTKKAVLSVLADVSGEPQVQKPNRKRRNRSFSSVSDVIIKQCRKVLRSAVAADEERVFCNLLGRTLLNTSDNDDEGLIGFPAMVSRPLDFRTIDLRLAFGAYGGSHEAFLEDVREVWHHIRTAYSDQSDLLQLAEKLSQDFEVLYQKEVLSLVQKFSNYSNIDSLNSEAKKELEDIFESASEIPKAPWDEGVCKVCGVDKDDDNVLLCDTCDSGYHTYCLTPPLAGVPEGNWYCPSCVTGHCNDQYTLRLPQVISRGQKRKYHGEFSHGFLESLSNLATTMEARDYWEYTARERIFLLKFLCDELLNSADIREHLEHCASESADLQQKLRSLYVEWRNLNFREESTTGKVARVNSSVFGGAGKCGPDGTASVRTNSRKSMRQPPRGSSHFSSLPNDLVLPEDHQQLHGANDSRKQPYWLYSKGNSMKHLCHSGSQVGGAPDADFQLHQRHDKDNSSRIVNSLNELLISAPQTLKQNCTGELSDWSDLNRERELQEGANSGSVLPSCEVPLSYILSDTIKSHVADHKCAKDVNFENQLAGHCGIVQPDINESQSHDIGIELKNLQDSIACLESQLAAVSLRKEPLGRDCAGRLYWAFSRPGISPWLVVDGTMLLQEGNITEEHRDPANYSTLNYSQPKIENKGIPTLSSWFSFQSDAEIEELVEWLTDSDAKDRELVESILWWQRIGNKDSHKAGNFVQDESSLGPSNHINSGTTLNPNGLITNALVALEKKHGPCMELEASKIPMRQCQSAESTGMERMYRCECLEPVWPSRCHCRRCHQSFLSRHELREHNDGICNLGASASQNGKDGLVKEKGMTMVEKLMGECMFGGVKHETGIKLSEFSKESASPYDIEEISAKFVTESSIKELVQEIGLIGSNGIPSFVPSTSPYLSDPTLKLVSLCRGDVNRGDESLDLENYLKCPVQVNKHSCMKHDSISNDSVRRCILSGNDEEVVKIRRMNSNFVHEKRDISLKFRSSKLGFGNDTSLRPLMGKSIQILRQLKINLLDMDAAVPEEALRSSKACWGNRCAWRAFVKSARSIFQMVQATIVFEDMIKTEFLRNGWWYWSSLSAAANIATVSSLALRLHTLDAAIVYERPSTISASSEIPEHGSTSDTDTPPCKESTDLSKQKTKSGKRRKEL